MPGGNEERDGEHGDWEVAAKILADHGEDAGDYVYRAIQASGDDHEALRRWRSIIGKILGV